MKAFATLDKLEIGQGSLVPSFGTLIIAFLLSTMILPRLNIYQITITLLCRPLTIPFLESSILNGARRVCKLRSFNFSIPRYCTLLLKDVRMFEKKH